jgi:hypothetical protein
LRPQGQEDEQEQKKGAFEYSFLKEKHIGNFPNPQLEIEPGQVHCKDYERTQQKRSLKLLRARWLLTPLRRGKIILLHFLGDPYPLVSLF